MKFEYTLKAAHAPYMYEKVPSGGGGQGSYNLPRDLFDYLKQQGAISDFLHSETKKSNLHEFYFLNDEWYLTLGPGVLDIIGDKYAKRKNEIVFAYTYDTLNNSTTKLQLIKTHFLGKTSTLSICKKDVEAYKWFGDLYDKNVKDNTIEIIVSSDKKEVFFDVVPPSYVQYGTIGDDIMESNRIYEYTLIQSARDSGKVPEVLQKIVYGAPGTGKSDSTDGEILKLGKEIHEATVRTTFHPELDYATFVGCYKPTMNDEGQIEYKFVAQAFTKAYVAAWKKFTDIKPQFLLIEEINRGNCAQIFGDLFQLLDRDDNGLSRYPIKADADLKKYLAKAFENEENLPATIRSGEDLRLPPNLYIWATMNTSDQSLFPMDSAFKRRWDWEYVPITEGKNRESSESLKWKIQVNGNGYDWWSFLKFTNEKVKDVTESDDKQLGYFFVKPKGDVIDVKVFVNKVLFYLYNDVFKTYGLPEKYSDYPRFSDFFNADSGQPDEAKVKALLDAILKTDSPATEASQPTAE